MSGIRTESLKYRNCKICPITSGIINSFVWKLMELQLRPWKGFTIRDDTTCLHAIIFIRTFPVPGENSELNVTS